LPSLFDTIAHHGSLTRSVDDARLFLAATQGPDEADILLVTSPLDLGEALDPAVDGTRLALSVDLGCWAVEPAVETAVRAAAAALQRAGASVEEVDIGVRPRDEQVWSELWAVYMAAYHGDFVAAHEERMAPAVLRLIAH